MAAPPLIEIRNATIWRGSTRVFENLDLCIHQHERVAILGPNGCGKTTLLKTINRELYPVRAPGSSIEILGRERWNVWELRRHIGVVSQDLHQRYDPDTVALEVVESGFYSSIGVHGNIAARTTPEQRAMARETLVSIGLEALESRPLRTLSTGQQRRCLLARALVHRPSTLILDEPTAGLDMAGAFDFLGRLHGLAADGCNIVIVTHHLNEIPADVNRVILLSEGRVVADGGKDEVLTEALLSRVYNTPIGVVRAGGQILAYPARANGSGKT